MKDLRAKLIMKLQASKSDEKVVSVIKNVLSSYTKEEINEFINKINVL